MAPPNARMMTSWIFMARSRAAAASTIVTSLVDDGCSATPGKSGHFTCSRERTDHVLPTPSDSNPCGVSQVRVDRDTFHGTPVAPRAGTSEEDDRWLNAGNTSLGQKICGGAARALGVGS